MGFLQQKLGIISHNQCARQSGRGAQVRSFGIWESASQPATFVRNGSGLARTHNPYSPFAVCTGSRAAESIFTICAAMGPEATTPSKALTRPEARTTPVVLSVRT